MKNDKRPAYLVVVPTGVFNEDGDEAKIIIGLRHTRAGADTLVNSTPNAIVEKWFLVSE
jgi:hypothetical protein